MALILLLALLSACNTYQAARGNTTGSKVAGGAKQDANAAGNTIERAAGEIGEALNKMFK
ncbi:MAG: hypothetical protein HOP24_04135 [Sideroxydans sp.]|nr:hypothetical protein [Sideroxydans sp.]